MSNDLRKNNLKWLLILVLAVFSILLTGCEKGSLGIKNGTIIGYVLEELTNKPIADVLVTAAHKDRGVTKTTTTGGDGKYTLFDMDPGVWDISVAKPGYVLSNASPTSVKIENGETVMATPITMRKEISIFKGTLKGYPVDEVTGSPLRNFTVKQTSPDHQIRSKLFENASEFKETGWTGLEGGDHFYLITAENYLPWSTGPVKISNTPTDLGVIKMSPERVSITGTLRNLPGYIFGNNDVPNFSNWVIWAESSGRLVATMTSSSGDSIKGTVVYTITGIPVTVGQVAVKCKIRGYDVVTINPAVNIPAQRPSGTITGVDCDFANIDPIRRDLRVVILSTPPSPTDPGSFPPGAIARVYIKQGGKDVVPYVDVVSNNYFAEAYFSGLPAGYPFDIIVVSVSSGYISEEAKDILILEDGNTVMTVTITLR